jgi:hypothetical protein
MNSSKKFTDLKFESYVKKNFPEHAQRILQSRSNANLVRFFYPLISFLIPVVFFASIGLSIIFFKSSILSNLQGGRLAEAITDSSIQSVVATIFTIGFVFAMFTFVIGLLLGLSKAKDLIFQSEQLEANMKQIWLLEKTPKIEENRYDSQ